MCVIESKWTMNDYLKQITDEFTSIFYKSQILDQNIFLNEILNNCSIPLKKLNDAFCLWKNRSITFCLHPINDERLALHIKRIKEVQSSLYKRMDKEEQNLINKTKNFFSSTTIKVLSSLEYFDYRYISFSTRISKNSKKPPPIFYISSEPNWKNLKEFYLDFVRSNLNLKEGSNLFHLYWKYYFKLINLFFDQCTPINMKMKFNLDSLKNTLLPITKNHHFRKIIKMIIKWKEFLKEIDVEKNVDQVHFFNFIYDEKLIENNFENGILNKYDYVVVKGSFLENDGNVGEDDALTSQNYLLYKRKELINLITIFDNVTESDFSKLEVYGIKCKK